MLTQVISQKQLLLKNITNRRAHTISLPPEILSIVFTEGYQQHSSDKIFRDPTVYLVTVSSVCRRWRTTALSTPSLWAQLDLDWSTDQFQTWIARSGTTQGLDLWSIGVLDRHGITKDASSFAHMADVLHRWRSISLQQCSYPAVVQLFERINEVPYTGDQLERIDIDYDSNESSWTQPPLQPDPGSLDPILWSRHSNNRAVDQETLFPRLRRVTMRPAIFSLWGMLSKLVHLDISLSHFMLWRNFHTMLTEATALKTLRVSAQREITVESLPLQMDALITLDIGDGSHDSFTQCWLVNVSAPALKSLTFFHSIRSRAIMQINAEGLSNFVSLYPFPANQRTYPNHDFTDFTLAEFIYAHVTHRKRVYRRGPPPHVSRNA